MYKIFIIFSLLLFSDISLARSKKGKYKKHESHATTSIKKGTIFSMCSRNLDAATAQTILIAIETLSEGQCRKLGRNKAEQYIGAGWKCMGSNDEVPFSCESQKVSVFAIYNGRKLDHLTFTNLQKRRSLIAYLDPNSNGLCHEDQADLTLGGVKDAICHKGQQ